MDEDHDDDPPLGGKGSQPASGSTGPDDKKPAEKYFYKSGDKNEKGQVFMEMQGEQLDDKNQPEQTPCKKYKSLQA